MNKLTALAFLAAPQTSICLDIAYILNVVIVQLFQLSAFNLQNTGKTKMKWIIILIFFHILSQEVCSQENMKRVILINYNGSNTLSCCSSTQGCHCSNLSLALENVKDDTEIKLISDISLEYVTRFGNVSNVTITGLDHTIQCNRLGGLVGEYIGYIAMQGVRWNYCQGVSFQNFNGVSISNGTFQHSMASYALKLVGHDFIFIENSSFLFNDGAVHADALSIDVHNSSFHSNGLGKTLGKALNVVGFNVKVSYLVNVTLTNSVFTNNSGPSLFCDAFCNICIDKSSFTNNFCIAVELKLSQILLKDDISFSNNSAISNSIDCGAAIYLHRGTLDISGSVYLLNNKAQRGGAVCLQNSTININQGLVKFDQNTADMGGAIFADLKSNISVHQDAILEFTNNSAVYGGALCVDLMWYDQPAFQDVILYYYHLLMISSHFVYNTATNSGSLAYFKYEFDDDCIPQRLFKHRNLFSTSPCKITIFDSLIKANASNYDYESQTVLFWIENLKFSILIVDYFDNWVGAQNITLFCENFFCNQSHFSKFNYTIDTIYNELISRDENAMACCNLYGQEQVFFSLLPFDAILYEQEITVQWEGQNCTDILHLYNGIFEDCQQLTCYDLKSENNKTIYAPPGFRCQQGYLAVIPGYWYDNGLNNFVISCPPEYCNFSRWYDEILSQPFPNSDLQCRKNWKGFSCGQCDRNENYFIGYGSTDCIPHHKCSIKSTPLSLFALFVASFFYWFLVIAFIFVLLHFKFNVIAGHAFGIIFYYSVLAQVVSVLDKVNQLRYCAIAEDLYAYDCSLLQDYASKILPFLFSIGTLKPPFMQYSKLCLGGTEMIDHIVLDYIHPLIVLIIITAIFVSSRRFVWAARLFGRYVNCKSICLLILLSYSSVSYTSVQLLRPLAHFKYEGDVFSTFSGLRPYWSPNIAYFEKYHACYVIIAILVIVFVGFGFPFLLLFQRYLIRHHNINLISIQPIIDQLQACYKNECYWFTAYYLICRQVIYGVDTVCDFVFIIFMQNEEYTFAKYIILLVLSILLLVIHLWFQPYRMKSLNILDGVILLTLVLMLVASLDGRSFLVSVIFWIFPLLTFINYLSYSTKMQHFMILSSVCGLIVLLILNRYLYFESIPYEFFSITTYFTVGIVFILCMLLLLSTLVGYVIYVLKKVITKVCTHAPRDSVLDPVVNSVEYTSDDNSEDDEN